MILGAEFAQLELRPHSFADKRNVVLLQAGDIFAWQAMKNLRDHIRRERSPRKDYLSLVEERHFVSYWTGLRGKFDLMISDPGLNQKPGEERRRQSVLDFMELLADEPDPAAFVNFQERWSGKSTSTP